MRTWVFITFVLLGLSLSNKTWGQKTFVDGTEKVQAHPRLLLFKGEEKKLKQQINKDAVWKAIHQRLIDEATLTLDKPVNERIKTGKRLLSVSRDNLKRIFLLSYAYRMTGEKKYAERAEKEMLKAASFSDWNPSHFLDVGEMTMALAIGYDWLYRYLSNESKQTIEKAIVEKGLNHSFDERYNWFVNAVHNWNQVCHAGVTYGALAVWDKNKELACQVINRAIEKIAIPMQHYAPDGAYPEGVGYWEYGTSFNVMFLSAIEKIFGTDFELSQIPGFLQTGTYILQTVTPALRNFAYSDNGSRPSMSATPFWFYDKTKDATILYNQSRLYKKEGMRGIDRLAPAMLIWGASASLENPIKPSEIFWFGKGDNPVISMRSDWDTDTGVYIGVKLGSPKVNHGHMDIGSFIFEADGVNWAIDMGGEEYNRLETRGVDLWNGAQHSQRWKVFRYNNFAHNTLTFNEELQLVKGKAEIEKYSDDPHCMYVTSDLTPVYSGQVKQVKRAVSLVDKKVGVIEDKVTPTNHFTKMTWTLVTPAKATIVSDQIMLLEKDGKKLYLKVDASTPIRWNVRPAVSSYSYDSPNNGISIVTFDTDLKRNESQTIRVYLFPGEIKEVQYQSVL